VVITLLETERRRPGLPNVQRRRPGVGPRIRGGRLGASSTTEIPALAPEEQENVIQDKPDSEQSPTSQSEQVEAAVPSASVPTNSLPGGNRQGIAGKIFFINRSTALTNEDSISRG
jgi:hypothetical protein